MKWTRETVKGELVKLFREQAGAGVKIEETSHLVADIGLDSLGMMEMIQKVEDTFRLQIPDEALAEIETVADVDRAIVARLEAEGRLEG